MLQMEIKNIAVKYGKKEVIKDVSCIFQGGNVISLIGPNGTGKTTILKAIAQLISYDGEVTVVDDSSVKIFRESMTYVPQMSVNVVNLTVFEMVLLGRVKDLTWKVEKVHLDAVANILEELHLTPLSYTKFSSLSGGQKQMVIMAQALVSTPKVLLLDEPTSALDLKHQLQVMEIARNYTKKTGAITILVLHDIALATRYSDQLLLLHNGYSMKQGSVQEVVKPELLEKVYEVKLDVSRSEQGYITVTPICTI
ncbi:ABC transporter ATP-binding protein [Fusobacterium gonidiaformans]|uniref:ABC transporter ATP-binding protein n=1 Tax=Fusobacterium gonidiaformans TaxID=849 RepID=UPI00307F5B71